jgi:hypothetical protein
VLNVTTSVFPDGTVWFADLYTDTPWAVFKKLRLSRTCVFSMAAVTTSEVVHVLGFVHAI